MNESTSTATTTTTTVATAQPVDTTPKPTGIGVVLKNITNWLEFYWWLPVSIIGIVLLAKFATFLTGRKPLDQGFDFVGIGIRVFICVVLIVLLSATKQAGLLGSWMTKEEQFILRQTHWQEGTFQHVKMIVIFLGFAWILLH